VANSNYFLRTARLGFRRWREDDIDLALGLWGDPQVTKLIDARGQLTPEQVRERLARELANDAEHGVQYWPIFLRHWRRGYALEAARAVMRHAFAELGASGLFAGHNPNEEYLR
jgi:[ribosomal protein S5]-alanine N-acetyltransferase